MPRLSQMVVPGSAVRVCVKHFSLLTLISINIISPLCCCLQRFLFAQRSEVRVISQSAGSGSGLVFQWEMASDFQSTGNCFGSRSDTLDAK